MTSAAATARRSLVEATLAADGRRTREALLDHLGDHDEVYLCLSGRIQADWEGNGERGSFEFGAGDVVHWPTGFTIRNRVLGDEPAHVFWVMGPAPEWMMPLTDPDPAEG